MDELTDIEKILAEREKIDKTLRSKFSKKISIMFTDIKGSTSFYESRGDIDGRLMVHRHNEVVMPILKEYNGELLKTIGDATMTVFDDPSDALNAAHSIQRKLRETNQDKPVTEQIHVRIGINYGTVIVEKGDVFGDVVNVASRVESLADAGEIFITEEMYREVKGNDDFIFRFVKESRVKGKQESLKVYRLVWHEEALSMGVTRAQPRKKEGMFVLEASVAGEKLKISGFKRAGHEERPVRGYKEIKYNEAKLKEHSRSIIDLLNRANRRGKISSDLLVKLKEIGRLLFDALIPVSIKEMIIKTEEKSLMISIDDRLVFIPWELMFDGKEFLCQRFNIGRSVSTKQHISAVSRSLGKPLKMQVLADPGGDLHASYTEGTGIKNEIGSLDEWFNLSLKSTDIRTDYVKAKIRNFDIVHYAGHAEHDSQHPEQSGWMLKDGKLNAEDIMNMTSAMPMPSLVFSNACQSGYSDQWRIEEDYEDRIFGLANAFLLTGVQHYIGTFWEIPDEAGSYFAVHFYKSIAQGATIGEAVRLARMALINRYGEDTIVWASYMLYGDPTTSYIQNEMDLSEQVTTQRTEKEEFVSHELRHKESVIQLGNGDHSTRNAVIAGICLLLVAIVAVFLFSLREKGGSPGEGSSAQVPAIVVSAEDKEAARKRTDALITSLAKDYRDGNFAKGNVNEDEWSSRPLSMVFMDVSSVGNTNEGNKKKLLAFLPLALQDEERLSIVERELLDKLLEELKLSQTELANPLTALRIGKLFSANIIMTGMIIPDNDGLSIISKFIDTETSQVKKVMKTVSPSHDIDMNTASALGGQISSWVREAYPLKGKIISLSENRGQVNLGRIHGLNKGDGLEIFSADEKSSLAAAKGEITISEVGEQSSWGTVKGSMDNIKEKDRIMEKKG